MSEFDGVLARAEQAHQALLDVRQWVRKHQSELDPAEVYRLLSSVRLLVRDDLFPVMESLRVAVLSYQGDVTVRVDGPDPGWRRVEAALYNAHHSTQASTNDLYQAGEQADRAMQAMSTVHRVDREVRR